MNDAYYNSDNLQSDGYDNWVVNEEVKERRELFAMLDIDYERFPLPIKFDEREEAKKLYFRKKWIETIIERFQNIRAIRYNKKYFPKCK